MRYLIILMLMLSSCSAEWHLRKAVSKNPEYGKVKKEVKFIIYRDTIHDTIIVPSHDFHFVLDSLHNYMDSFHMVYNDSFVTILGKLDSVGKLKFKGTVKERLVPYEVIVHDTIKVTTECPPNIVVNNGYPKWYLWLLIAIFVLFILYSIKK